MLDKQRKFITGAAFSRKAIWNGTGVDEFAMPKSLRRHRRRYKPAAIEEDICLHQFSSKAR